MPSRRGPSGHSSRAESARQGARRFRPSSRIDLLAALADEAESRAAELMARVRSRTRTGAGGPRVWMPSIAIFEPADRDVAEPVPVRRGQRHADRPVAGPSRRSGRCHDAGTSRRAWERVGTEHLLAGLIAESLAAARAARGGRARPGTVARSSWPRVSRRRRRRSPRSRRSRRWTSPTRRERSTSAGSSTPRPTAPARGCGSSRTTSGSRSTTPA